MKYIKLFEDFRIIKETPKWFYLVLRIEKAWDSLLKMEFNGLVGVADNPEIINSWFDVRDTLLVMKGDEFLKLNSNVHKINYDNPNSLVSNNFKLLNRLLQNSEDRKDFYDVIQKIFSRTFEIKSKDEKIIKIIRFLNYCLYEIENIIEKYVVSGKIINNIWGKNSKNSKNILI